LDVLINVLRYARRDALLLIPTFISSQARGWNRGVYDVLGRGSLLSGLKDPAADGGSWAAR
jgi:hypothetical protein